MTRPLSVTSARHLLEAALAESLADPWGQVSAADHETGALVRSWAHAPDRVLLRCVHRAVGALVRRQHPAGGWGPAATDFLARHWQAGLDDPLRTSLWHAKELFEPTRVVHSLVLTRLSLAPGGKPWTS